MKGIKLLKPLKRMSDIEDPYAVSSDSEDEDKRKPPPKINIEGRTVADFQKIVSLNDL